MRGALLMANRDLFFHSDDLGVTEDFLGRAYAKMSVRSGDAERPATRVERRWLGGISFDQVEFDFNLSYEVNPLERICLCRVHAGHIDADIVGRSPDVFAPGDVTLYTPPDLPFSGTVCKARYDVTMFDTALLDRVATTASSRGAKSVRLLDHRPVSAQAQRQLNSAIEYVRAAALADHTRAAPLIRSTAATMLASVVVATLPTTAKLEPTAADRSVNSQVLVRRAIAYIETNAQSDIALADIAGSVYVTPRALQYMFRRQLDMSPMEYLRRVRLDLAHRELLNADPATTTVQSVAARWGFAHMGRFSAQFRAMFGRNPSDALRS